MPVLGLEEHVSSQPTLDVLGGAIRLAGTFGHNLTCTSSTAGTETWGPVHLHPALSAFPDITHTCLDVITAHATLVLTHTCPDVTHTLAFAQQASLP